MKPSDTSRPPLPVHFSIVMNCEFDWQPNYAPRNKNSFITPELPILALPSLSGIDLSSNGIGLSSGRRLQTRKGSTVRLSP